MIFPVLLASETLTTSTAFTGPVAVVMLPAVIRSPEPFATSDCPMMLVASTPLTSTRFPGSLTFAVMNPWIRASTVPTYAMPFPTKRLLLDTGKVRVPRPVKVPPLISMARSVRFVSIEYSVLPSRARAVIVVPPDRAANFSPVNTS